LNFAAYIAQRLSAYGQKSFSRLIVRIAVAGVALSVAVMIISLSIVTGFQQEIRDKITGFGSHIQIAHVDLNNSYETAPIYRYQAFNKDIKQLPGVKHIQGFATKAGLIRTENDIEAIVLKGIGRDFNWSFFNDKLSRGKKFVSNDTVPNNEVIISKYTADKLHLDTGMSLVIYFIQEPVRVRKFKIAGIYETGLEEFDKLYMLCDIGHIQKLNDWSKSMVGGFEILLDNFDHLDDNTQRVNELIGYQYEANSIREINPNLFEWLELLDVNVVVIMVLMFLVSTINMITAILILILERTQMIGLFKAFGSTSGSVRKIFLIISGKLILQGIFWGNIIGAGLCLLQKQFSVVKLDQASYYMNSVPVNFQWSNLLLINLGTFILCCCAMLLPLILVNRISPIKSIRFE
jgi:lipoprotein-releasing system permease protein